MADARKVVAGSIGAAALGFLAWKLWLKPVKHKHRHHTAPVTVVPSSTGTPAPAPGELDHQPSSSAPAQLSYPVQKSHQFTIIGSSAPVSSTTSQASAAIMNPQASQAPQNPLSNLKQQQMTSGWTPNGNVTPPTIGDIATGAAVYATAKTRYYVVLLAFFQQMSRQYQAGQAELIAAGELIGGVGTLVAGLVTLQAVAIIKGVAATTSGILREVATAHTAGLQNLYPPLDPATFQNNWQNNASGAAPGQLNSEDHYINDEWIVWVTSLPGVVWNYGQDIIIPPDALATINAARAAYLSSTQGAADWSVLAQSFYVGTQTSTNKSAPNGAPLIDWSAQLPNVGAFADAVAVGVPMPTTQVIAKKTGEILFDGAEFSPYWG